MTVRARRFEVGLLGDEAEERRSAAMLAVAPTAMISSGRLPLPEPGQSADIAGAGGVIDDCRHHEQRRLEHCVRARMASPASIRSPPPRQPSP